MSDHAAGLRADPAGPTVVLSPHLDDAVLGAFTILTGPGEVLVVNVCDGVPPPGSATGWVRLCGGTDDAAQALARLAEDAAALALAGCEYLGLGFLDADERPPDATPERIAEAIEARVPSAAALVAPIGIGRHPDHTATRDAAIALALAHDIPLELHADMPYAVRNGWPYWVSGEDPDPHLDPAVAWQRAAARVPTPGVLEPPRVAPLDKPLRARKAEALECYASQLPALAGGPYRRFDELTLSFEAFWTVPVTPTG